MSALLEASEEYLTLRRAMGFKLHRHGRMLAELVTDLESAGQETITTHAVLEWAIKPAGHPQEWASRLSVARGFARYLRALDGVTEVPPAELLPSCRRRLAPYLYSEQQIAAVMAATASIYFPQRGATYRTLIGLLAVTGMRIGETIALDRDDVDLITGCVTIRAGKWNAARELPLHDSTVRALRDYRQLRDRCWPTPKVSAFFLSMRGTRAHPGHFRETFHDLCDQAGVTAPPGGRQPRIHEYADVRVMPTLGRNALPIGLIAV